MSEQQAVETPEKDDFKEGFASAVAALGSNENAEPDTEKVVEQKDDEHQGPVETPLDVVGPKKEEQPKVKPEESPEKKEGESQADWEHRYKSMLGRHKKLQDELAHLKTTPPVQTGPVKTEIKKAEIPDEQKYAVDEFKAQYPQYSEMIEMAGKDGEVLRRVLEEVGPDMAALKIESLILKQDSEAIKSDIATRTKREVEESRSTYELTISNDHPDEAAILFGTDPEKADELIQSVNKWAKSMPYEEAQERLRVIQSGTTKEVSELLTEFKKAKQPTVEKDASIDDAMAVPSKRTAMPTPKPGKDDFSGAFKAAAARLAKAG